MYPSIIKNKSLPNILVFGGTGYLGGNLVNRMINKFSLNEKYNIIVLSSKKNPKKHESVFKNVYLFNNINCFDNQKCKYIIHSIGIFNTNLAYKELINNKSICKIPSVLTNYICSMAKTNFDKEDTKTHIDSVKQFYKWNYQSLENIAENVSNPKTKLIYISANKSPLASKEYIDSKRLSEKLLVKKSKKILLKSDNKISLRDLINYLVSNDFVFNKKLYFTNIDKLNDKICEKIIEAENNEIQSNGEIIKNSDI
ncbi:hypothetical protein ACO0SA_001199 [Hanseniaspora valbyensis]